MRRPPAARRADFDFSFATVNDLPIVNQRRQVESDHIHLQFDSIGVLNHGFHDGILDLAVVQVHADFVADLEVAL
jgi:hypothetical protein